MNLKQAIYTAITTVNLLAQTFAMDSSFHSDIRRELYNKEYTEDVIQDICLDILNYKNPDLLIELCEKNQIKYWIMKLVSNKKAFILSHYHSADHRKITIQESPVCVKKEEEEHFKYLFIIVEEELKLIQNKNWYSARIFREYINLFNKLQEKYTDKQLGEELNIDRRSLNKVLCKVKTRLRHRLDQEL